MHKKGYWHAQNDCFVVVFFFLTTFSFSFEIIMNMVTPQGKSEVGERMLGRPVCSSEITKNG